mmetsp:Transcript_32688/g.31907  ORF Transcript_32688/g.31907 Transcript_32688/m.31907 type:complete len:289 (+) Transcript_32688:576-1442(+)
MKKVLMDGSVLIKQKFESFKENKENQVDAADLGFAIIHESQLEEFLEMESKRKRAESNYSREKLELVQSAIASNRDLEVPLTPLKMKGSPVAIKVRTPVNQEIQCELEHPLQFLSSLHGKSYSVERDVDRYFSKQYIDDTKKYFSRLLDKSEKMFKEHREAFIKMPQVYKRLWSDVLDKAVRFDKIKEEYQSMRSTHWAKVAKDLGQNHFRLNQGRTQVVQRDPHSGKVFINLVELYSNKNIQQIVTNPNQKHLINYLIEESIFKDEVKNSPLKTKQYSSQENLYAAD